MRRSAFGQGELRIAAAALALCVVLVPMSASTTPLRPITIVGTSQEGGIDETRFLAGLQWNFGNGAPEVVLGIRSTRTFRGNDAYGGKLDIAVPVSLNWNRPVVRVMAVAGVRQVQLEFGGGVRLIDWRPVLGAGLQGHYSNGGTNYLPSEGFAPYLGVNDLGALRKPATITTTTTLIETPPG
jgi:hypothetical protein